MAQPHIYIYIFGLALTLVARRAVSIWMHLHPAAVQWRCWSGAPISPLLHLQWGLLAQQRWPVMELGARIVFLPVGIWLFDYCLKSAAPDSELPLHHWSYRLQLAAVMSGIPTVTEV